MNRRALILLLVIILTLLPIFSIGSVYASGTTTITASGTAQSIGRPGSLNTSRVAQSFQISSGYLSQFTVKFAATSGIPTGTVTYEFRADLAGSPTGSIIETGVFTPVANSTNSISLSSLHLLANSTTYWLVLSSTNTQSSGAGWSVQAATTSTYANGTCETSINGGAWIDNASDMEASFTTVDPTATPTPTATLTPTVTPTLSATPTLTLTPSKTPTPDFYSVSTLSPSGQAVATVYTITGGETAMFGALIVLIVVEFVKIFLLLGVKSR